MNGQLATRPLGEIVEFQRGLTYSKRDEVGLSSNIVLRANNVDLKTNQLDLTELRHISDKIEISPSKKLKRGSLLICTASGSKSHLGKVAIIDNDYDYAFGGFMGQLTAKPLINPKYLFYFMISDGYKEHVRALSDGVNINNLRFEDLKPLEVPLPPLPEQQRIVDILDEAFAGLATATANAKKNLKNARELFESYLNSVFSEKDIEWTTLTVGEAVECGQIFAPQDGNHGEIHPKKSDYVADGVPFIMASDLQDGEVNCRECNFISEKTAAGLRKGFAKNGDVLLSHKGTIGRVAILTTGRPFVVLTPQVTYYRIKNTDILSNRFLRFIFESALFQSEMTGIAGVGSTRAYIGITKQLELMISYPRLTEQLRLVSILDAVKEKSYDLEKTYLQKVNLIKQLKQSILQKAFSGELTSISPATAIATTSERVVDPIRDTAIVLAFAQERHRRQNRDKSFLHTKAQKILHEVETEAEYNLDRNPIQDAAGPNDFKHMLAAEEWAEENGYFKFLKQDAGNYQFKRLNKFDELLKEAQYIKPEIRTQIERVIDIFIPMDAKEAADFSTVRAAWNNLLHNGETPTDDAIIAACYAWHPKKSNIPRSRFVEALRQIRKLNMQPTGRAPFVPPASQGQLAL